MSITTAQGVAVSRLCHPGLQCRPAVRPVRDRAAGRRSNTWWCSVLRLSSYCSAMVFTLGTSLIARRRGAGSRTGREAVRPAAAAGRMIALDGEAGFQAELLSPGWHFGSGAGFPRCSAFRWSRAARRDRAGGGRRRRADPAERILGREVACDDFRTPRPSCAAAASAAARSRS